MTYKKVGEDLPEIWEPKEGDSIEGVYKGNQHNVGKNKSNIYSIKVEGELKNVWGSTVLDRKMISVEEEDQIRITYDGKAEEKDYKKYTVEVDGPEDEEELKDESGEGEEGKPEEPEAETKEE